MDFDTEVMVRLYWQGNDSHFVATRVTYPADGLSHFDALKDNCRISWMHTRLFLGMLPRILPCCFAVGQSTVRSSRRSKGCGECV